MQCPRYASISPRVFVVSLIRRGHPYFGDAGRGYFVRFENTLPLCSAAGRKRGVFRAGGVQGQKLTEDFIHKSCAYITKRVFPSIGIVPAVTDTFLVLFINTETSKSVVGATRIPSRGGSHLFKHGHFN